MMKVRLLPGQVVIREEATGASDVLWTPAPGARATRTHTGRVLALGPPARVNGTGAEVPHGFDVGDLVQYHLTHLEKMATNPWPVDGLPATWVPQENVDGVWEYQCERCGCRLDFEPDMATMQCVHWGRCRECLAGIGHVPMFRVSP